MRRIQNGIAAVITKEKLFNRRVILGGFIILASAFASYMTMATYVPSLVHAQESEVKAEKRDNRSLFVREGSDDEDGSQGGSNESGSRGSGSSDDANDDADESADSEKNEDGSVAKRDPSSRTNSGSRNVSPVASLPSETSDSAPSNGGGRNNGAHQGGSNARPTPPARASQFNASGCGKHGTSVLRHQGRTAHWDNYGEYGQGSRGECVRSIQRKLNNHCTNRLDVDGQYGPATQRAVRAYQSNMRSGVTVNGSAIHVDGIAGVQTFALMQEFGGGRKFGC